MKTKLLLLAAGAVGAIAGMRALAALADRFEHQLTDGLGCCGPDECCTVYHAPEFDTSIEDDELNAAVADWRVQLGLGETEGTS